VEDNELGGFGYGEADFSRYAPEFPQVRRIRFVIAFDKERLCR
jgi:hypothetical protein